MQRPTNIMKYIATVSVVVAFLGSLAKAEDPWTPSPLCPFPSEDLTRSPYEGDCSKYWECFEGARYPMQCPEGLEWNAEESKCDNPTEANCDPDATVIYPTYEHSTVSTVPTQDPGPAPECPFPSDEITFYPVVNNCSQYWECFQGNRYLMSCPPGQYWNQNFNYCDYPSNVNCTVGNSTTTAIPSTTPENDATDDGDATTAETPEAPTTKEPEEPATTTENTICVGQTDGTYLADPDDCSRFYECVNEKPTIGQCPDDLVWNVDAHVCDFPANVSCDRSAILKN